MCQMKEDGVSAGDSAGDGDLDRVYPRIDQPRDPLCGGNHRPRAASLYDHISPSHRDDPPDPLYRRAYMDVVEHGGIYP